MSNKDLKSTFYFTEKCKHENLVNDFHNGCLVCTDCGYVQSDQIYYEEFNSKNETEIEYNAYNKTKDDINEIIFRLNLPDKYTDLIIEESKKTNVKLSKKNINDFLYNKLNTEDLSISIKDIQNVTEKRKIKPNKNESQIVIFKIENCLEKYCTMLNLNYKDYTVIKENILKIPVSGHNPLTIIGSFIYKYSKENKKKLSMKKISTILQISPISIQRYLKNELSCRN
jgi:transcription initiation factor TFIIIB Brf1 subunit/transcription initiation factor TFIIB